jgi:hypothetical protein
VAKCRTQFNEKGNKHEEEDVVLLVMKVAKTAQRSILSFSVNWPKQKMQHFEGNAGYLLLPLHDGDEE